MHSRFPLYKIAGIIFVAAIICLISGSLRLLQAPAAMSKQPENYITIFMSGDVMTGRGIDQILPYPGDPVIHEPFMRDAGGYVKIAEEVNGPIPKKADWSYIWGNALAELKRVAPDLRVINLETAITASGDYERKGINYRMNPKNIPVLTTAGIDYCSLANNHTFDWGYSGLEETIGTLKKANIRYAGAGLNINEAEAPAVLEVKGKGRVVIFSYGSVTSGIPSSWGAGKGRPGVNLLEDFSDKTVRRIKGKVAEVKKKGNIVVASIHWGSNWGYDIPPEQRRFAHNLIEKAGIDVIHGHSSHHVKGIEVYKGKLILYGSGDFLNDYEGISGYEEFRDDLGLMYFASLDPALASLKMTPTRIKNFRINLASKEEARWLRDVLNREGKPLGTRVELNDDNTLTLRWD